MKRAMLDAEQLATLGTTRMRLLTCPAVAANSVSVRERRERLD
jgi:hypothetical protein